jgi:hypothetical protein
MADGDGRLQFCERAPGAHVPGLYRSVQHASDNAVPCAPTQPVR